MTRARALKQLIRDRAAKTGERYTTARRHILKAVPLARSSELGATSLTAATTCRAAPSTKGGLSDAKSIEKTGHGLAHWFDVLDRFGGVAKGHTALARHLYDEHGVPGWYCQGITVAYERARGVRAQNQRCDGAFEVSVSKVMTATTAQRDQGHHRRADAKAMDRRRRSGARHGVDVRRHRQIIEGLCGPARRPGPLPIQVGRHHRAVLPAAQARQQDVACRPAHQAGGRPGRRGAAPSGRPPSGRSRES